MSRRRTGARYVPITISLKPSMVDEIETKLNANQSRSAWIAKAIMKELSGEAEFNTYRDGTPMHMFNLFKAKMDRHGIHIDSIMWDILEANCQASTVVDGLDEL